MIARDIVSLIAPILIAWAWIIVLKRISPGYAIRGGAGERVVRFFFLGTLSVPLVIFLYWYVLPPMWSSEWDFAGLVWNHVVMVGIIEEFAKWGLFAVGMHRGKPLRSPEDGVVLAAAVALAFSSIENVRYSFWYGPEVLFYRGVICVLGHMTYAAVWGFVWAGITWETGGKIDRHRFWWGIAAIVPAGIIHGLYNTSLYINSWLGIAITIAGVTIAVVAYRYLKSCSPYRPIPFSESARAVQELSAAVRVEPNNVIFHRRLGLHLLHQGNFRDAILHFERARRLTKGSTAPIDFLLAVTRFAVSEPGFSVERCVGNFVVLPARVQEAMREQLPHACGSNGVLTSRVREIMTGDTARVR